jgi:hypothetical protein
LDLELIHGEQKRFCGVQVNVGPNVNTASIKFQKYEPGISSSVLFMLAFARKLLSNWRQSDQPSSANAALVRLCANQENLMFYFSKCVLRGGL